MLKYKVNIKSTKKEYVELNAENSVFEENGLLYITIEKADIHKNDTIAFSRMEKEDILFYEERIVRDVIADEENDNKITIVVDNFQDIILDMGGVVSSTTIYQPTTMDSSRYLNYFTRDKHILFENRNLISKESLPEIYNPNEEDRSIKRCPDDYVVYNNKFLYTATSVNNYNRYVIGSTAKYLNKNDGVLIVVLPESLIEYFEEEGSGTNWEYKNGALYLKDCITPSLSNGKDNRNCLMWEITNSDMGEILLKNALYLLYKIKDNRFIQNEEEVAENASKWEIRSNTVITKKNYSLGISNLITEDFSANLLQEELLNDNYVKEIKELYINDIIDYEKQIFEPVFEEGGNVREVKEIDFILNFRARPSSVTEVEEWLDVDYGEWKAEKNSEWNNYKIVNGKLSPCVEGNKSDLLGYLGFTDEDLYYMKKKLSKSFLRLSFYDSIDRTTQNLLFTSTIFMKEGEIYSNFVKNLKAGVISDPRGYCFTEDADYRLDSFLKCKGKYSNEISNSENYNSNYSSEGFYLYLFPSVMKGSEEAEIYMKVEFNHAKYGYRIPFIKVYENLEDTPVTYKKKDEENRKYIDTRKLFKDMYIPIKLMHKDNRYTWTIDNAGEKMIFHLLEPRINGD